MSTSRDANCLRMANMSSCLRMALAFSTATSSAKLNSSVGDFDLRSCSFISCMQNYSKGGRTNLEVQGPRAFVGAWGKGEGEELPRLGGRTESPLRAG